MFEIKNWGFEFRGFWANYEAVNMFIMLWGVDWGIEIVCGSCKSSSPEFLITRRRQLFREETRLISAVMGAIESANELLEVSGSDLESLGSKGRRETDFRRVSRVAAGKLLFGPLSYEDGELMVLKFLFWQINPCNFEKLQFKPWTKLSNFYKINLLILNFQKLFLIIYLNFKNSF